MRIAQQENSVEKRGWVAWFRRRQWHPTPVLLHGKSHRQRSLVGCSPWGCYESDTTERLPFHFSLSRIGEGNGNPLWCSCLENPRDGVAWWASVYGVAQSRTWLKWLNSSSSLVYAGNQQNFKTRSLYHLRRPQASFHSPEGEETLRPPWLDLRSPGIISKHGGLHAPDGNSARVWERERHGETSISRNWSQFFIFQSLFLYTEMLYKSHMGTAVLTFIKVRCFTQMYTEVLGVLHHLLARAACWQFTTHRSHYYGCLHLQIQQQRISFKLTPFSVQRSHSSLKIWFGQAHQNKSLLLKVSYTI